MVPPEDRCRGSGCHDRSSAGRVDETGHERADAALDEMWAEADVIDVDDELVRAASVLARRYGLRGYDAVHCAAAAAVADDDLVAAAGDQALLRSWREIGVATYDTAAR